MKRFTERSGERLQPIPWGRDLCTIANRYADHVAVRDAAGEITYRMMFRKAAALAEALRAADVKTGEPVATFFRNGIPAAWAHYGVLLAGAADVPINPALSAADIRSCLAISKAERVVTTRGLAPRFQDLQPQVLCTDHIGEAAFDASS